MKTNKAIHNSWVKDMRRKGILPPLGMTTASMIKLRQQKMEHLIQDKRNKEKIPTLSENGSLLPNKYACWDYPFDQVTEKDE